MNEFLKTLYEHDRDERRVDDWRDCQEVGTVMDVVIATTRSRIGSAFSEGAKVPAKLKDSLAA